MLTQSVRLQVALFDHPRPTFRLAMDEGIELLRRTVAYRHTDLSSRSITSGELSALPTSPLKLRTISSFPRGPRIQPLRGDDFGGKPASTSVGRRACASNVGGY